MIEFRTKVDIPKASKLINHSNSLMLVGSCFSESIGQKLHAGGFRTLINPFGVLYNPISIANNLQLLLEDQLHQENELGYRHNQYFHFAYHTSFSGENPMQVLEGINRQLTSGREFMQQTDYLILTLGSAFIYQHTTSPTPVANCHKIPDSEFSFRLLTVQEIVERYMELLTNLRMKRPELQVIFTISPVRHWKYGAHGNQVSKAVLLLAVDEIIRRHADFCSYFPSYELIMDELRDYRFYSDDMLHISNQAVEYIYGQFTSSCMEKETQDLAAEIGKLWQAAQHRIMHPGTAAHESFLQHQNKKIQELKKNHPKVDLDELQNYFENQLREMRKLP